MNDDEIRALVRAAIKKHMGASLRAHGASTDKPASIDPAPGGGGPSGPSVSISFGRYALARAADDAMCLIEPAVACNHCGYCECHGH